MVGKTATAKGKLRRAEEEILEIGISVRRVGEKQFAVEDLRENFVEIDERHLAANADDVSALHPAESINYGCIVLGL